jgi:NAD(P)-dependent dehydrogenase (short-subunit alcohol dehydrogenase family)
VSIGNIVIAGGSKGIGLELVKLLEPRAERIDVWSRTAGELPASAKVRHGVCDFADPNAALPELPEEIQGAVYCPGTINLRSFRSLQVADFRQDLEVNLIGAIRFLQACQPRLKGRDGQPASVVLFSTVAVGQGMPMHASVAASKGAIEGLMRSLAAEWAPKIRVNAIAPALTDTPLASKLLSTPEKREAMATRYPLKRIGTAEELARAAMFLVSSESNWVTGQVLGVDGGMSTCRV